MAACAPSVSDRWREDDLLDEQSKGQRGRQLSAAHRSVIGAVVARDDDGKLREIDLRLTSDRLQAQRQELGLVLGGYRHNNVREIGCQRPGPRAGMKISGSLRKRAKVADESG
jgi:hypothetical protein